MNWFNIPKKCVFEKEIPLDTLTKNVRAKNSRYNDAVLSSVESCYLYACLNESTYSIECHKQNDAYFNEIVFLAVKVKSFEKRDLLTKYLLRVFGYQTVIVYERGDESCIAVGFVRDAKKVLGNRKVEQYRISRWLNHDEIDISRVLDLNNMDRTSYEGIYRSIYNAINDMDNERYIPLSFVADLYAYSHALDVGWPANIEVQDKIKALFPQNRIKAKSGNEVYRFTEDETLEIMCMDFGYTGQGGDDLIETLYNLIEYESDFNIKLPERVKDRVYDFEMAWYEDMEDTINMSDEEIDKELIATLLIRETSTAEDIEYAIDIEKRAKW